jgi:hypothetical protein
MNGLGFSFEFIAMQPEYLSYVYEALMLLNTLCISNRKTAALLITEFGFDPKLVIELATSFDCNLRIREVFLNMAVELILANNLFYSYTKSKFKDLCFKMQELEIRDSMVIQLVQDIASHHKEGVEAITNWSFTFWLNNEPPFRQSETIENKLLYL